MNNAANNTKELHHGIAGNGAVSYLVVTVDANGRWAHIETFDNEPEAISWIKWS